MCFNRLCLFMVFFFFFSSRRRHTRFDCDWSSDVCSSDLHLLIRDAAYDALPKAVRVELHERFAVWLEEHGADLVELDEILGYHLEQACRYRVKLRAPDDRALTATARTRLTAAGPPAPRPP